MKYEITKEQVDNISRYIGQVSVPVYIGVELGKIAAILRTLKEIKDGAPASQDAPVTSEDSKKE